jgi:hypothetical protein
LRYPNVYVLLLYWEDEDPELPVSLKVDELHDIFQAIFCYHVEVWKISGESSHLKLNRKILDFIELGSDSKDDLKVEYYGGYGMLE